VAVTAVAAATAGTNLTSPLNFHQTQPRAGAAGGLRGAPFLGLGKKPLY
jgi:hypothetical protein